MHNTPVSEGLKAQTRICITDNSGLVLADSANKILQESIDFPGRDKLYGQQMGYLITTLGANRYCIAHAKSPGYETYATGWHSVIMQQI